MKPFRALTLVTAAALVLSIVGCMSFGFTVRPSQQPSRPSQQPSRPSQQPSRPSSTPKPDAPERGSLAKGETGLVTGHLAKDKNQFVLTESRSGVAYRFVGLRKEGEAQLAPHVGRTVTVRLTVRSTSGRANNCEFLGMAR